MSSRQFTQFGGSGEIVTLDDINEYDDLPPLAEIDRPDVYEIRTGELGTDYLVPMQDGSTDFNEWYSLVDGQIILDIPDSGNLHAHYDITQQPENVGETIDPLIDHSDNGHDLSAVGSPELIDNGFTGGQTASLDGSNDAWIISSSDWATLSQPYTAYTVVDLQDSGGDQKIYDAHDASERSILDWDEEWRMWAGSFLGSGDVDLDRRIIAGVFDGGDSVFRIDRSTDDTGNVDGDGLSELAIGRRGVNTSEQYWDGEMVELLFYNAKHDSDMIDEVESYLNSKYSLGLD